MKINIKQTWRKAFLLVFIIVVACLLVCLRQYETFPQLFKYLITFEITILTISILVIIIYITKNKGLSQTFRCLQIINSLEQNLISIGAYYEIGNNNVLTPSIKIDIVNQEIRIDINDLKIRSRIEANKDYLSSSLPNEMIVYKTYVSKDENTLIIKYKDISKDKRLKFDEPTRYIEWINDNRITSIKLDKDNSIDLTENNGILITGKSGSGKSFFAQQILIQGIVKHWNISILDYKRSYQAFKEYCRVAFTIDEIVEELESILSDLHSRQEAMDEVLKVNPQALAIDNGFPVKFVLVEEYLALVNSGADKKTLDKIEKMILEITTTGRSLNVYLCMVLQVSSSQALNTSIRANLPIKIVFGNPERTIYETTFGKGSIPNTVARMEKGEGLCSVDGDIVPFSSPFISCKTSKILDFLK